MQQDVTHIEVMKARAVRQATIELISENRDEIIKRARAKLVAMGIELKDEEVTGTTPQDLSQA